jgi:hypothetical protein
MAADLVVSTAATPSSEAMPNSSALMPLVSASVSSVMLPTPIMMATSGNAAQAVVAHDALRPGRRDRLEDGVGEEGPALSAWLDRRVLARPRSHGVRRDQHRRRRTSSATHRVCSFRRQQVVGAAAPAAQQLGLVDRIDADGVAFGLQLARTAVLEVRRGRLRQAAEVDDVGTVGGQLACAPDDGSSTERRGASTISAKIFTRSAVRSTVAAL